MKKYMSGFVALFLVLALAAGMLPPAAAAEYTDVAKDHWAYSYIQYLSNKEVLSGDGNGLFRPDASVTRAEFIRMMVSTFGLTEQADISYTKVPEWAVPFVKCAAAQGFLLNYKTGADFGAKLSRQEAVSLLLRYLGFAADKDFDTAAIPDYKDIGEIYRPYVCAAVEHGIVRGYEDGSFKPERILTRAEALTILYQSAGSIYNTSASFPEIGGSEVNATVNASVTLTSLHLSGNVYITEGAHFVTLKNCSIDGTLYVRGSGQVTFTDTTAKTVIVEGAEVTAALDGASKLSRVESYGKTALTIGDESAVVTAIFHTGAEGSTVKGGGTMQNFGVYCKNVSSEIEPDEYYIASGVSARICGVTYASGSGRFKNSGLTDVTAAAGNGKITIRGIASVNGTVYAAMWMNNKTALSLVEIIEQASKTEKIREGESVTVTLSPTYDPSHYCVGLVVMPDGENAAALAPLYSQGTISETPVSMGTSVPEPVKAAAPTASIEIGDGIVALRFDQKLYIQSENGQLVEIGAYDPFLASVTKYSDTRTEPVPSDAYRCELRSDAGKTSVYLYFYEGIPADTSYTLTISDHLFSIYGIAPDRLSYTTRSSLTETEIRPVFVPSAGHISRGGLLTVLIPQTATSMRYAYTIDGTSEPSMSMIVQGNAELEFDTLPANTKVHVTAVTLTASGSEIGEKIEGDFVVNAAPIVIIGGVSYTDADKTIDYVEPVSVSALPPSGLSELYTVRLYINDSEIAEQAIVASAGTQIRAELVRQGEVVGETKITLR